MRNILVLIAAATAVMAAEPRPDLRWQGYINGSAILYAQGERVDAQGRETGAIDRPGFHFNAPLPAERCAVHVEVRQGKGKVTILEQPVPENEYSTVVRIDSAGTKPEYYVLDFHWSGQTARSRTTDRSPAGEVAWTGTVDREVLIRIHGEQATVQTVRGKESEQEPKATFTGAMPANALVRLLDSSGRGRVELIEQPAEHNNGTAVIRIADPQEGFSQYSFRLSWSTAATR
jgi:hypothetical protein